MLVYVMSLFLFTYLFSFSSVKDFSFWLKQCSSFLVTSQAVPVVCMCLWPVCYSNHSSSPHTGISSSHLLNCDAYGSLIIAEFVWCNSHIPYAFVYAFISSISSFTHYKIHICYVLLLLIYMHFLLKHMTLWVWHTVSILIDNSDYTLYIIFSDLQSFV